MYSVSLNRTASRLPVGTERDFRRTVFRGLMQFKSRLIQQVAEKILMSKENMMNWE
jgi:hypothetical protein